MEIGKKIKARRIELDMTQAQLAEKIHVSRSTISNWEIGRNYPDIQMIVDLSYCLDISIDTLLKGDDVVVTHITNDTRLRKKQKFYIKGLIALLVLVIAISSYSFITHYSRDISQPREIRAITIDDSSVHIKTDLPFYKTVIGYMASSTTDSEDTIEVNIMTGFNYKMAQESSVEFDINDSVFSNGIKTLNIINDDGDIIATQVR